MEKKLSEIGLTKGLKEKALNVIDRQDKMRASDWKAYALDLGFSEGQFNDLAGLLNSRTLFEESEELRLLFNTLASMGVKEYVEYDARVVRGLDYYTGVVFEGRDVGKSNRAILGGGRYDNLVKDVGGDPLTGVGFAMGDVVIPIILADYDLLPEIKPNPSEIMITLFDENSVGQCMQTAAKLRREGFSVQVYPETAKLGKQFKYADKNGISYAITIGPDEIARGVAQVKNLETRDQVEVDFDELIKLFQRHFCVK